MSRLVAMALAVCFFSALASSQASAFHGGQSFGTSANGGGGGGLYFSGSPRWKRYDCSICHADSPGLISLEASSEPAELLEEGRWTPGANYLVTIKLLGETRGLGSASNINTAVAEFVDDAGEATGRLVAIGGPGAGEGAGPPEDVGTVLFDRDRVISTRGVDGRLNWQFRYIAPSASSGPITLYVAAVDGNGADDASERKVDTAGDDTAVLRRRICEQGAACAAAPVVEPARFDSPAAGGCQAGGWQRTNGALWLLVVLLLLRRRRAGRGRRTLLSS